VKLKRRWIAAVSGAIAIGIAALGGAMATAKPAADPYKIMIMIGVNTVANNFPEALDAAQVAADKVNAQGGLGGRQIQLTLCNHQQTTDGGIACAQQAVQGQFDDVLSYNFSLSQASTPVLIAGNIPQIGGLFTNSVDFNNKLAVPIGPPTHATHFADAWYEHKYLKDNKFAIIGGDTAAAHAIANFLSAAIRHIGGQVVGQVWTPTLTAADYSPFVQQLKQLNPQAVDILIPASSMPSFTRTAAQFGLNTPYNSSLTSEQESDLVNDANNGNGIVLSGPLPLYSTPSKGAKQYLAEMTAAGKTDPRIITSPAALWAWTAIYALQALSKKVQGPVTAASMLAAAHATKTPLDVKGMISWIPGARGPAAFPNNGSGIAYIYQANGDGKLVYKTTIDVWKTLGIARK